MSDEASAMLDLHLLSQGYLSASRKSEMGSLCELTSSVMNAADDRVTDVDPVPHTSVGSFEPQSRVYQIPSYL